MKIQRLNESAQINTISHINEIIDNVLKAEGLDNTITLNPDTADGVQMIDVWAAAYGREKWFIVNFSDGAVPALDAIAKALEAAGYPVTKSKDTTLLVDFQENQIAESALKPELTASDVSSVIKKVVAGHGRENIIGVQRPLIKANGYEKPDYITYLFHIGPDRYVIDFFGSEAWHLRNELQAAFEDLGYHTDLSDRLIVSL